MRSLTHAAGTALGRLSPREQRLLGLFAAVLLGSGFWLFVVEPVTTGQARMEQRVATLERDLVEMAALATRIRRLESDAGTTGGTSTAPADFSLFAFIDRAASTSVRRDAIASMNPSRRSTRDGYEETSVDLRVNGVSLAELVALLQRVEDAEQPVYIKRMELKRRYDDITRFDATVVAGVLSGP